MKHILSRSVRQSLRFGLLCLLALSFGLPAARAGLTFDLRLIREQQGQSYNFYVEFYTNSTPPAAALGTYLINSPQQPTNGSWRKLEITSSGLNFIEGGSGGYSDFNSVMDQITNGNWTIVFTNATTTNYFQFAVSAPNMTSNMLPALVITQPTQGATLPTTQPTFAWQWPDGWGVNSDAFVVGNGSVYQYASLPEAQHTWYMATPLPVGQNLYLQVRYTTNNPTPLFVATTPINTNTAQPISGWISASGLTSIETVDFAVTNAVSSDGAHTLVAHYAFDDSGNPGLDSSGNGNDISCGSGWGPGETFSTDAIAGGGAMQFFGGSSMTPCGQSFTSWTNTLAGSFTVSAWIKTTNVVGNDGDDLNDYDGQSIIYADNNNLGATPVALTGSKVAFRTTDPGSNDDTLHSVQSVTTGSYVHIVSTRDQSTGEKRIYINGVLDSSDVASTEFLSGCQYVSIGGELFSAYVGLVDDVQIYSGVLSAGDVASLYANPGSTVANGGGSSSDHINVAHYAFDDSTSIYSLGLDSSPNGNNMVSYSVWGPVHTNSSDAVAGGSAVQFFGTSSTYCYDQVLTNLNAVLVGSFTFSTWVKTTVTTGSDDNEAFFGAVIFWAYNDQQGNTNDTIPLSITGSKVAFSTRDHLGNTTTIHSLTSVNDGNYHLITVTRNQSDGEKKIYVDGNFEASELATTDPLNGNNYNLTIGGMNYYSDGTLTNFYSYKGLLDDFQIYSGVLSASEVLQLYNNPGTAIPDLTGSSSDFSQALNTTGLTWITGGNLPWFVETTDTHDSASAAQSGAITDDQESWIETTVTGPGTLSFWCKVSSEPDYDVLEFLIDGDWQTDLTGDSGWQQQSFEIASGSHILRWRYYKDGSNSDGLDAGFLDQVTFIPDLTPIITLNPFNQTNYPGYNVALLAAATNSSSITWQWFKVGNSSPIPNATNALFMPTNSGTAGVAGSYYAVASSPGGSANTSTALVSFVSAPMPPDWAHALKSPFGPVDGSVFNRDYYLGCAVDSAGDIYVAAQYFGNMNVRTNGSVENILTAPGSYGAALVKHSANGNALWAVGLTNNQTGNSFGLTVAAAPGNGAYLASQISGTNWLGTNKFVDADGSSILLSRFDANGSNVWSKLIGGTNSVWTGYNMLVSDDSGNVTLAGSMSGTVSFGGTNLSAPAGGEFIVQYDATGAVRWAQTVPVYTSGLAYGSGLLYVSLQSTVSSSVTNVSIGSLSNVTDRAWAVACLNASNGQPIWLRGVGHQHGEFRLNLDRPLISVSGSNVFLTANTFGASVVFGGLSVPLPGGRGQYFARYDTNGTPWAATVFGSPTTTLWASAANASGVYVSGDFNSYSQFGALVIAAPVFTTNDLDFTIGDFSYIYFTQPLIAKFDLDGNPLWARNGVSSAFANFRGIAATSDGVWASGFLKTRDISSPAQFGTNFVSSDLYVPGGGLSTINFTQAGMIAKIAESTAAASTLTLLNPQTVGSNFQFQFVSQTGFNHSILYRTNLVAGNWRTNSTIAGDGTLKTITVPLSLFSPSAQGFIRVSTQ